MKPIRLTIAALLLSTSALAQNEATGALPPGKPAGVKQAEINEVPYLLGTIAIAAVAGALIVHFGTASAATTAT